MKVTTTTGIELDTEGGWAASATEYAKSKGLKNILVFRATDKDDGYTDKRDLTVKYIFVSFVLGSMLGRI